MPLSELIDKYYPPDKRPMEERPYHDAHLNFPDLSSDAMDISPHDNSEYTVAWLCTFMTTQDHTEDLECWEWLVALHSLDKIHGQPSSDPTRFTPTTLGTAADVRPTVQNKNRYYLGEVQGLKVVLLPLIPSSLDKSLSEMDYSTAMRQFKTDFQKIEHIFIIGTGSALPALGIDKYNTTVEVGRGSIRLGDVVVAHEFRGVRGVPLPEKGRTKTGPRRHYGADPNIDPTAADKERIPMAPFPIHLLMAPAIKRIASDFKFKNEILDRKIMKPETRTLLCTKISLLPVQTADTSSDANLWHDQTEAHDTLFDEKFVHQQSTLSSGFLWLTKTVEDCECTKKGKKRYELGGDWPKRNGERKLYSSLTVDRAYRCSTGSILGPLYTILNLNDSSCQEYETIPYVHYGAVACGREPQISNATERISLKNNYPYALCVESQWRSPSVILNEVYSDPGWKGTPSWQVLIGITDYADSHRDVQIRSGRPCGTFSQ